MADKSVPLSKKLIRLKKERETRERAARIQKDMEEKARAGDFTADEEPEGESQASAATLDYSQSNEAPASLRKS